MAQGTNLFTSHEARILAVNAGSEEQPVYFTGGEPTATSYSLKATVNNGDAKYVAYYSNGRLIASSKPTSDMRMPAHYYHNLYRDNPTTGTTVYVHYYNTDTTSTNTYANLRVKSGSTFKTFAFGGDGGCSWDGHILANGGQLRSTVNGNTVTIGSQNTGFCHITSSANVPFWFNKEIQVDGSFKIYNNNTMLGAGRVELSGGTPYIDFHFNNSTADYTSRIIEDVSGQLYINGKLKVATSRNGYALNAASFICDSWVRTVGDTGWFNETYGGGWWMYDSTWIRSFNNKSVYVEANLRSDGIIQAGATGGTTLTQGRLNINTGANPEGNNTLGHGVEIFHDSEGGNIRIYSGNVASYGSYWWEIDAYNGDLRAYNVNSSGSYTGQITIRKDNVVLFGAAWNDYAEMRNVPEANDYGLEGQQSKMAGRCVQEVGDDTMIMTNDRLQPGCKIVSDTFGFNIGETEECKTPIAVSGRVLAYLYEGREAAKLHIGRPVCSGPNGTVSIMTEDEEKAYPSRIVGIISAVPDYKYWGTGNVEVNGRIWIYVR